MRRGALDGLTDVGHSVGSACMDRLTLKPYSVKVRIVVEKRIHDYSSLLHFPLETGLLTQRFRTVLLGALIGYFRIRGMENQTLHQDIHEMTSSCQACFHHKYLYGLQC